MPPGSNLGQLNTNDWERLQACADRFEAATRDGQPVDLLAFLKDFPPSDPLRRTCLHELIKLDLEIRWRRRDPIHLGYYVEQYAELGPARSLPASLLFEEYLVRLRHGDKPSLETYRSRFPEQFEEFARIVRERDMPTHAGMASTPPATPSATVPPPTPSPPTPFTAPTPTGGNILAAGTVLATGHKMIKRIGIGGFGEVWEVLAPGDIRTAMKVILRPLDHEAAKHELEALELIKNLRHHFLLKTHAFWPLQDRLYIAMDLADCSLRDRLKQVSPKGGQGLPLSELMLYCTETAEALDYLHSKKVMHRDIKPENLLLSEGHIRVADFGLAMLHEAARSITGSGSGTPLYMPPEFWREKVSLHSDQYSFAASYVELRLGRRMFPEHGFLPLMTAHLEKTPDLNPLPEAEQAVLLRALSKEPEKRYPSCGAFVGALQQAVQTELCGKQAPPETEGPPQGVPGQSSWGADTDWETRMPGEEGRRARQRTGSGTQPIPQVWHPELRPWRPKVAVPLLLVLIGLLVWLLVKPSGEAWVVGPGAALPGSPPPPLPARGKAGPFVPVVDAGTRWVGGREYYKEIDCRVAGGPTVRFLLIPSNQPSVPTFYMMQDKVTNELFAVFANADPKGVREPYWQLGARADRGETGEPPSKQFALISAGSPPLSLPRLAYGLSWAYFDPPMVKDEDEPKREKRTRQDCEGCLPHPDDLGVRGGQFPVFRVWIDDAHRFAQWMGGLLPSDSEWDWAAGRWADNRGKGPYNSSAAKPDIAIGRLKEGPRRVGQAKDDVSVYGCHDMAGNGLEWTRTYVTDPLILTDKSQVTTPEPRIPQDALFLLRGKSYIARTQLTFEDLSKGRQPKEPYSREGGSWTPLYQIAFRVIVRPGERPAGP